MADSKEALVVTPHFGESPHPDHIQHWLDRATTYVTEEVRQQLTREEYTEFLTAFQDVIGDLEF